MSRALLSLSLVLLVTYLLGCRGTSKATSPPETAPAAAPAYFKVDPHTASVIKGSVTFSGKRPKPNNIDMDEDPECSRMHRSGVVPDQSLVVTKGGALANAFVYLKTGMEGRKFEPPAAPVTIDQRGCWFEPRVLGAQTGQILKVTNSDPVTHNIHPLAHVNREWNHSQGPGDEPLTRRFTRPEIMIPVKCNIHNWMHAFIGVVDHPYFAVSGPDGSFEMRNVPPGTYTVAAWQEKLGTQEQSITIPPSGTVNIVFNFHGE